MFENVIKLGATPFIQATLSTLYMVSVTAIFAGILGLFFGTLLVTTQKDGVLEAPALHTILDKVINLLRSIPFIILLALVAPLTVLIVNTRIGDTAAIVPLVFGTFPFFARQVENSLATVEPGMIEAARSMGETPTEIIFGVYLKEALPSLIRSSALTLISLIGLSAMAGIVGAGGLGKLAIAQGYNRFQDDVTLVATLIILVLVYLIQGIAHGLVKKTTH